MVVYSTPKGLASVRFHEDGSPLLETLASTIAEYSERKELSTTDIETLIKKVKYEIHAKTGLSIEYSSTLTKEFHIPAKGYLR